MLPLVAEVDEIAMGLVADGRMLLGVTSVAVEGATEVGLLNVVIPSSGWAGVGDGVLSSLLEVASTGRCERDETGEIAAVGLVTSDVARGEEAIPKLPLTFTSLACSAHFLPSDVPCSYTSEALQTAALFCIRYAHAQRKCDITAHNRNTCKVLY